MNWILYVSMRLKLNQSNESELELCSIKNDHNLLLFIQIPTKEKVLVGFDLYYLII